MRKGLVYMDIARSREKYVHNGRLIQQTLNRKTREARDVALGLEIFVTGALEHL